MYMYGIFLSVASRLWICHSRDSQIYIYYFVMKKSPRVRVYYCRDGRLFQRINL
jgi:hypothetical protein